MVKEVGKASSFQSSGFTGSGALSHVHIQYPPLRCRIPGYRNLFYDDGSKLLLAPISDQIFSWKTAPFDPHVDPLVDLTSEGPCLSVRYSFDSKLLAIQRSNHEVQIWNKEGGGSISYKCRSESGHILGSFWTDCPTCDIVFVNTRANLENLKVHPNIYVLTVRLLVRSERHAELGLFIVNKVNTVRPSLFLEAAHTCNDSEHLAAVLRFFSDFIPGFKNAADHGIYSRVLAEMSASVVA